MTPLGNAEVEDVTMIVIVVARRKDAAGRHCHCIISVRDVTIDNAPSHVRSVLCE
jgi:hypothetical protein